MSKISAAINHPTWLKETNSVSMNFNIWVLYPWACSNLPGQARSPRHSFRPLSLCKCCAPSPANVWNKLNKQNTVGNLGSVLIRNIFTHGVRLYITYEELWFEPPFASIKHWNEDVFLSDLQLHICFFFLSCSCRTLLWIVQMHNSTCLLGNMFKC